MDEGVRAYGVREQTLTGHILAAHAERVRVSGYTVLPGGFDEAELADYRSRLDLLLERQADGFGRDRLHAIGDAGTVRCPLAEDERFLQLAIHADVLTLCRLLIGDYVVLMQQNGVVNMPGEDHTQAAHHRDLPYQHFTSSRPLAVSALFCLDPFRTENGATTVIPGSHRAEAFPSAAAAAAMEVAVEAAAGAVLVFDSMIFHRAGRNRSGDRRRGVNHVFTIPLIAQQVSLPDALGGRYADDPALAPLLGYHSVPARSARDWRERRLNRQERA